jgi:hypothetical protein
LCPAATDNEDGEGRNPRRKSAVDMVVNPYMLDRASMAPASAKSESEDFQAVAGVLDADQVSGVAGLPSLAMWKAVQTSYARLTNMIEEMRKEVGA